MEFIAEAMQASIDLTRTTPNEHSSISNSLSISRPSSSLSYTPSPGYQQHPGLQDTNLTIFYRPVYPTEQQSTVFNSQCSVGSYMFPERTSLDAGHSAEGETHYDNTITNGMRVMHFMDHQQPEVFHHQYPSIYLPDGLTQHPSSYYPSVPTVPFPPADSYNGHSASSLSFSPMVVTPQPTYHHSSTNSNTNSSSTSGVGFQPYHPQQQSNDNSSLKRIQPVTEIKATKRKNCQGESFGNDRCVVPGDDDWPPCSVCGDVSTGLHYGVVACEGCKGFFRRAMVRKANERPWLCSQNSGCEINRDNRNGCRACRLRLCLQAGMVLGSGTKRQKPSTPKETVETFSMAQQYVKQWIGFIIAAHAASFTPVSEVFTSRMAAVLSIASDQLWPPGCDLSKRGFQAVQHFAHSLPFISYIPPDLRTHLLENNSLDMMILRTIFRYSPQRESFIFPPGAEVTVPSLSASVLGSTTTNRLVNLGRLRVRLAIADEELAFLTALALLSRDALSGGFLPTHAAMLQEFESKVLSAFHHHMVERWPSRPLLIGKLIALLSDIRALQHNVPMHAWLEPAGPISLTT